jgi:hypothetical protein
MATVDQAAPLAERPPQMSGNPLVRVAADLASEWRGRGLYPPGPTDFDIGRTMQMARDPLPILLGLHARAGGQPLRHRR